MGHGYKDAQTHTAPSRFSCISRVGDYCFEGHTQHTQIAMRFKGPIMWKDFDLSDCLCVKVSLWVLKAIQRYRVV